MLFGTYYQSTVLDIRHRMTLDKSLDFCSLGSPRSLDMSRTSRFWSRSRRDRDHFGLLSRATASNSRRKNIELSKISPDSNLYSKVAEWRDIIFFLSYFRGKLKKRLKYLQSTKIQQQCHHRRQQP